MSKSRREFLRELLSSAATLFLFPLQLLGAKKEDPSAVPSTVPLKGASAAGKVEVIQVQDDGFRLAEGSFDVSRLKGALDKAIARLCQTSEAKEAWLKLFSPRDTIGIKVNTLSTLPVVTHPTLVEALCQCLVDAGIKPGNIIVWDRSNYELQRTGFKLNRDSGNVQCFGTELDYEKEVSCFGSVGSCFSKIVTRRCTALINVPILKDHDLAGVTLGMKNFYGAIHNPNKYHDFGCDPFVADLSTAPFIRDKLRLVVVDGLDAQYHGGPAFKPAFWWKANMVLLGRDPVAVDAIGTQLIEEKRKEHQLKSLAEEGRFPQWLKSAEKRGLGVADPNKIEVIKL